MRKVFCLSLIFAAILLCLNDQTALGEQKEKHDVFSVSQESKTNFSVCYMQTTDGRIIDLSRSCGKVPIPKVTTTANNSSSLEPAFFGRMREVCGNVAPNGDVEPLYQGECGQLYGQYAQLMQTMCRGLDQDTPSDVRRILQRRCAQF
jgi:hypothetical protein